jgi:hypothetical protein
MPSNTAHAAETTMCSHVLDAKLACPFALYTTRRTARYVCMNCLLLAIEQRLRMPGQNPSEVAECFSFDRCEHTPGEKACWTCLEAATATLTARWAMWFYLDHSLGNQLRRIVAAWNRHYDPHNQRVQIAPDAAIPAQKAETPDDRRVRLARERIARRNQELRQRRGFPEIGTLQEQGKQAERIVTIAPVA